MAILLIKAWLDGCVLSGKHIGRLLFEVSLARRARQKHIIIRTEYPAHTTILTSEAVNYYWARSNDSPAALLDGREEVRYMRNWRNSIIKHVFKVSFSVQLLSKTNKQTNNNLSQQLQNINKPAAPFKRFQSQSQGLLDDVRRRKKRSKPVVSRLLFSDDL